MIGVTLTGVDESTDVWKLLDLSEEFPFVEFGVLYSESQQGSGGRYPSFDFIHDLLRDTENSKVNLALHICGSAVDKWIGLGSITPGNVHWFASRFDRIQLNFNVQRKQIDFETLNIRMRQYDKLVHTNIITQHNESNKGVWRLIDAPNHHVLFDASGGRGIETNEWPKPIPTKVCGYAGGLGPDNIIEQYDAIEKVANLPSWIDMEGKLRTDDKFDLEKCRQVLVAVQDIRNSPLKGF